MIVAKKLILLFIEGKIGKTNFWQNLKKAQKINGKYSSSMVTAYIKNLDEEKYGV